MILSLLMQMATGTPPMPPPAVRGFCTPIQPELAKFQVDEDYHVIGQQRRTGKLYSGTLRVQRVGSHYQLVRVVGGNSVRGVATPVACGPDEVHLLQIRYANEPAFNCKMSVNYDNYSVASCGPGGRDGWAVTGLEAWYPNGAP
ncbi:hypothetical protein [uncultured Xanthomonas sp.]|uniref:hypothetical protein n=1 Tax=uncultured Xanthomonas sp. TaxID=152831 RepID=UPI0025F3D65D|nr:hypothetical protein [uncultured Xanthomonas sp.]